MNTLKNVLVLCTGNSCRSQIAHGWLSYFTGGTAAIYSAGIEVHGVNSKAVATMAEEGIDISGYTSNLVEEYNVVDFDFIITVCDHAAENCPIIPSVNAERIHCNFSDPSKLKSTDEEKIKDAFRETRKEIKEYCEKFVKSKLSLA
ncbi:MAG: arsenate reductase [Flavobacteriaceae bacterium]|jgi:arsenate reductase|tara:strand:- start:8575 stop:9012 length:438 start_codon:yes stop_codon:yes gene_type:complete